MAQKILPPKKTKAADPHDQFKMRTLEQILLLFNDGNFLAEVMDGHQKLMHGLLDHNAQYGPKGCKGTMSIQLSYAVGKSGDVGMGANATFTPPKAPPSSAAAYINDAGELTLYSPMMAKMHAPIRDVEDIDHDPETGEVRDVE